MTEAAQTWTLAFDDADLEAGFRADMARHSRRHYRIVVAACLLTWLSVIALDDLVGGTPANARHLTMIRLVVAAPILGALAVGWLRPACFERVW